MDILQRNAVVKFLIFLICKMPQPIPLATDLCVERPNIIIDNPGRFVDDFLMEQRTIEEGFLGVRLCG
jgi:hypothetical protein